MNEKPEALRLADLLKAHFWEGKCGRDEWDAAARLLLSQHAENERLRGLLLRIRAWDHLDGAADGSFWKREIDAAMQEDKT
jgi:hypothetical protein